jgi:hypothetical protein
LTDWLVVTCEHGGNRVPHRYRPLFHGLERALETHLGYDFGALRVARDLAAAFRAPVVASTVTRLVVDLNRSIGHPRRYGKTVRSLVREERESGFSPTTICLIASRSKSGSPRRSLADGA